MVVDSRISGMTFGVRAQKVEPSRLSEMKEYLDPIPHLCLSSDRITGFPVDGNPLSRDVHQKTRSLPACFPRFFEIDPV